LLFYGWSTFGFGVDDTILTFEACAGYLKLEQKNHPMNYEQQFFKFNQFRIYKWRERQMARKTKN
jgi:hypothetical protein